MFSFLWETLKCGKMMWHCMNWPSDCLQQTFSGPNLHHGSQLTPFSWITDMKYLCHILQLNSPERVAGLCYLRTIIMQPHTSKLLRQMGIACSVCTTVRDVCPLENAHLWFFRPAIIIGCDVIAFCCRNTSRCLYELQPPCHCLIHRLLTWGVKCPSAEEAVTKIQSLI